MEKCTDCSLAKRNYSSWNAATLGKVHLRVDTATPSPSHPYYITCFSCRVDDSRLNSSIERHLQQQHLKYITT
ncbi:hypothetical protein IV203_029738 [Nitzschia inconspicua]|uniref:Uncharacterized protein n=1 Tax=Nitzschia inconspicua TaxID=303405 RepID=A0A9K3LSB6_9STRA|nr:hypothetical protein IV203_029738 [Nitzschia inconspicua]